MRRVLVPLPPTTWGGLHAFSQNIALPLNALGWEQVVVVPQGADAIAERLAAPGLTVVQRDLARLRRSWSANWSTLAGLPSEIASLSRLCADHDIAVVQAVGAHHYHGALTARKTGLPLVWQLHSDLLPRPLRPIAATIIRNTADIVMTNGAAVGRSFFGNAAIAPRIFHAPLDPSRFANSSSLRSSARAELGLPETATVVGTVGNRVAQKDHALLIEVARRTRHLYPQLRYVILGADNPNYRQQYQAAVSAPAADLNRQHPGYVTFADPGTRVPDLIGAFDIFCLTSRAEGLPLAVAEAGAAGLPVISIDVGALSEAIEDGVSGYLVPRNRDAAAAFAQRIGHLLAQPDLRRQMGEQHRQRFITAFSAASVARVHADAYEAALRR